MITGIIQASGFSRRMKKEKLLIEIDHIPLIEKVIRAAVGSKLDEIILIYRNPEIKKIGERYKIKAIENLRAELGQSEALKLGVKNAGNPEAYMFMVGDQPFLTAELIDYIINNYKKSNKNIAIPFYNEKRGMPMIISSEYKDELLHIEGDKGGRQLVNMHLDKVEKIPIEDLKLGLDIDTVEDLNLVSEVNNR